jgi:hypothetical protein
MSWWQRNANGSATATAMNGLAMAGAMATAMDGSAMDGSAMDGLAMDGTRAWLWTAWQQCNGDGRLVRDATATGWRNGDGRLDCDGNERLGYRRLGNRRRNGLAMDGLTATRQQWLAWRQRDVNVSAKARAMDG